MSRNPSPPPPTYGILAFFVSDLQQVVDRARGLLEGELADYPEEERTRIVNSQMRHAHRALAGMLATLALFAAIKVGMILTGLWPVAAAPLVYVALLVVCTAAAYGYGRADSLRFEATTASVFVLAFLTIIVDPMTNWPDPPTKSLGILLVVAVIGMPLMVLLRSAIVFAASCVALVAAYFIVFPTDAATLYAVLLNLAIAVTAGLRLRVARSDLSAGFSRSLREAQREATTDDLTGLLNRQGWSRAATAVLNEPRASDVPVTLLFLDLDHFKQLNDTHGHVVGDLALRRVGRALMARLQSGAVAARIGGEEFVCLLPAHSPEQVHSLALRLRRDIASASPVMTFSGGVARWDGMESISQLMGRADAALYRAKKGGRDAVLDALESPSKGPSP